MTPQTVRTLARVNQRFYEISGSKWNPKPDYYWEGWFELLKYLEFLNLKTTVRVLDIGCGNGRFANFLTQHLAGVPKVIEYLGVDFAAPMLEQIPKHGSFLEGSVHRINRNFAEMDLINTPIDSLGLDIGCFDIVVAFGLIHHIPSGKLRTSLVASWAKYLAHDGLLVMTTWQYMDVPRLAKHCLNPEDLPTQAIYKGLEIDMAEMEQGDNLLKWVKYMDEGQYTLRYSHYFKDSEIELIMKQAGLKVITNYRMDGGKEVRNRYWLCKSL